MRPQIAQFNKDPDADLDYACDWSGWLVDGDTISESTWILPDGATLTAHTDSFTTTHAIVWFRGGTLGQNYSVVNRVSTAQGRTEDQTVAVYIQQH